MTPQQPALPLGVEPTTTIVAPGAVHVRGWLRLDEQADLLDHCRQWSRPPAGLRRPRMLDGTPFNTRSVCLGWHWYPYRYSRTCDDGDGAPVKPFPDALRTLALRACEATGYEPVPFDASIVNVYDATSKLGLHKDHTERIAGERGSPVVTISLGDSCTFRFGNTESRTRPYTDLRLDSGDLFVFGGPARLAYHGVPRIFPGTAPPLLGVTGRVSVTIRESGQ